MQLRQIHSNFIGVFSNWDNLSVFQQEDDVTKVELLQDNENDNR